MDRRGFLKSTTGLFVAPAIVSASSLMPIFVRKQFPLEFIVLAYDGAGVTMHNRMTWDRAKAIWSPTGEFISAPYSVLVEKWETQMPKQIEFERWLNSKSVFSDWKG